MRVSNVRVGDVLKVTLLDHNVPSLSDVDGPELAFEAFGRVVRIHKQSIILQTWGNPPVKGRATLDENTEMLRILKSDITEVRKLR